MSLSSLSTSESIGVTNAPTTTSASFIVIPEMTITNAIRNNNVLILFCATFNLVSGDNFNLAIFVDGVEAAGTRRTIAFTGASGLLGLSPGSIGGYDVSLHHIATGLSVGSHTFEVRWAAMSGAARAVSTNRKIIVAEVI